MDIGAVDAYTAAKIYCLPEMDVRV